MRELLAFALNFTLGTFLTLSLPDTYNKQSFFVCWNIGSLIGLGLTLLHKKDDKDE